MENSTTIDVPVEDILNQRVQNELLGGWNIESQTTGVVKLCRGKKCNHVLHLLLTVFTLGFWAPIWIVMALVQGEKHKTLFVSADGLVKVSN